MEVKINKDIKKYSEKIFFGLGARQFIFSLLAAGVSIAAYITLRDRINTELLSWICVILSAPAIFFGFFTYNGMSAEKFLVRKIKCMFYSSRKISARERGGRYAKHKISGF